jgi:hypothetical protein
VIVSFSLGGASREKAMRNSPSSLTMARWPGKFMRLSFAFSFARIRPPWMARPSSERRLGSATVVPASGAAAVSAGAAEASAEGAALVSGGAMATALGLGVVAGAAEATGGGAAEG